MGLNESAQHASWYLKLRDFQGFWAKLSLWQKQKLPKIGAYFAPLKLYRCLSRQEIQACHYKPETRHGPIDPPQYPLCLIWLSRLNSITRYSERNIVWSTTTMLSEIPCQPRCCHKLLYLKRMNLQGEELIFINTVTSKQWAMIDRQPSWGCFGCFWVWVSIFVVWKGLHLESHVASCGCTMKTLHSSS